MNTHISVKKLGKEVRILKDDIREMKRFLFSPSKDQEGEYREHFVKKILSRSQSGGPFYRFRDKDTFLKHVRSKK